VGDGDGDRIGTDANGVSDALEQNVISGNADTGVLLGSSSSQSVVAGNIIGADVTGTVALPNANGVAIAGSPNNTIGGTAAAARNLISGNSGSGILIRDAGATGNLVKGNSIGTNAA